MRGLWDVIDPQWLQMFSEPELQVLISGSNKSLDVEDLKRHTRQVYTPGSGWCCVAQTQGPCQRVTALKVLSVLGWCHFHCLVFCTATMPASVPHVSYCTGWVGIALEKKLFNR